MHKDKDKLFTETYEEKILQFFSHKIILTAGFAIVELFFLRLPSHCRMELRIFLIKYMLKRGLYLNNIKSSKSKPVLTGKVIYDTLNFQFLRKQNKPLKFTEENDIRQCFSMFTQTFDSRYNAR